MRLKKIVRGYEAANQWGLNPILDKALMPELLKLQELDEHRGKPVLVFCPTRKSKLHLFIARSLTNSVSDHCRIHVRAV